MLGTLFPFFFGTGPTLPAPPPSSGSPYETTTLAVATTDLAARLSDSAMVRWSAVELQAYLVEALRTWNALTGHFRDHGVFQTASGVPFYDLSAQLPALRGYTITDAALVSLLEYHLLEPQGIGAWAGSEQFVLNDLVQALQRRRDQFLLETGMVLDREIVPFTVTTSGRVAFDEMIITVRRVAWTTVEGTVTPLHREDVWDFNHFYPEWIQNVASPPTACPIGYSVGETPPLMLQIAPVPSDLGNLDILAVERGAVLNPAVGVLLGIPDDWVWVVKWGALADLLSKDGLANDQGRASYCEQRWQQGIEAAKTSSVLWAARVNNIPVQILPVTEADDFNVNWQTGTGMPDTVLSTFSTLFGLSPVPDSAGGANYAISVDVIRNTPVPVLPTDFMPVGPELYSIILDYAMHLALVKEGMPAIQNSMDLLQRFYRAANVRIRIDLAQTPNLPALTQQSVLDEAHTERMTPVG